MVCPEKLTLSHLTKKFPAVLEPKQPLPFSQEPDTGPYAKDAPHTPKFREMYLNIVIPFGHNLLTELLP
jgi:hypothetical protein